MKKPLAMALCLVMSSLVTPSGPCRAEDQAAFKAGQAARARGVDAFRAGDLDTALAAMEEALTHRPGHPLLLGNVAYLAAATGDGGRAYEAAQAYAALGLVPGAEIQAKIKQAITPDAWRRLEAMFARNDKKIGMFEISASFNRELQLVEGIAEDDEGTLYAATVVSGGIYRRDGWNAVQIVDAKDHEFGSFFGMTFHDGALYATFARVEQTPGYVQGEGQTGLAKIDPKTGDILKVWTLPDGTDGQQIADLTITATGTILLSDAQGGKVYRVAGDTLEVAFSDAGFMSPQGIAELPGNGLFLADYGRGIWHLDEKSGAITLMEPPANTTLLGIDGLIAHKGRLYAIQNGVNPHRIIRITVADQAISAVEIVAQNLEPWKEPTLGFSSESGVLYVAASQWPKYGEWGAIRQGAAPSAPTPIMLIRD
ncbi:NHL repeat-containing protein [Kordiimonas aestuarii]|uniref:hypothetical protein n=1 Tax=Kordiimonas aestuarii TaxID=1005925 RepID=UPI0021D32778|nr:hypothetical protein [Kordiimonas aestuarii]